jgi:hypothetical protein
MFSPDKINSPAASPPTNSLGSAGVDKAQKKGVIHDNSNGLDHDVVQIMLKAVTNVSPMMKVGACIRSLSACNVHD